MVQPHRLRSTPCANAPEINKTDHFGINQPCRKADVIASQLLRWVRLPTLGQMGSLIVELPIERLGSDVPLILDRHPSLDVVTRGAMTLADRSILIEKIDQVASVDAERSDRDD